jgi:hypothetical protein
MCRQVLAFILCLSLLGVGNPPTFLEAQGHMTVQLSQSTQLKLILNTLLSTRTSRVGDPFIAQLAEPVVVGNKIVLPGSVASQAGSSAAVVTGVVTALEPAKRLSQFGRQSSLVLRFDRIKYGAWEQNMAAILVSVHDAVNPGKIATTEEGAVRAKQNIKGDLVKGGVGAGAGSLLGLIFGSVSKGLIIGLIGGSVAILGAKGKNVELQPGTGLVVRLDRPLDITVQDHVAVEKLQP